MATEVKRMDIKDFRKFGFLQEANRLFFHPIGLALEVIVDDETEEERLGGIWDYRDDPEGILYGDDVSISRVHIRSIEALKSGKIEARRQHDDVDENGIQQPR